METIDYKDINFFAYNTIIKETDLSFLSKDLSSCPKDISFLSKDLSSWSKDLSSWPKDISFLSKDLSFLSKDLSFLSKDLSSWPKDISIENKINTERESFLKKRITNQLIETIIDESFEFGIKSKSEIIIEEQLNINALATRNWLNEIFIEYFDDEKIIIGILRIIGRFDEGIIFPQGQTIALAALIHKSTEIKELGVRAFENWGTYNSIKVLENIDLDIGWLSDYKNEVIEDIKEELYASHS